MDLNCKKKMWFGDVPNEWRVIPCKAVFSLSQKRVKDDPSVSRLLSVSGFSGVKKKNITSFEGQMPSEDIQNYRVVERGQLVVNTMWLNYAGLGVSDFYGYVSPAYAVYDIRDDIDKRFAHYLLRSSSYVQKYTSLLYGIRPNSLQIKSHDFNRIEILLPPKPTQKKIVSFLDEKTEAIDAIVEKKKKLIALLKEKRASIITHAVTKGLDPNAKMKPSGIDWIGDIPSDWSAYPGFFVIRETKKKNIGLQEDNLLSLSYGNIIEKGVDVFGGLTPASFETYQIVYPKQIIFRLTDLQNDKRSLRSGIVKKKGIITSAYTAIKTTDKILPEYLHYLYRSYDYTKVFYTLGAGVRQSSDFSELKRLPILLPSKETQEKIISYLDEKTKRIDETIEKIEKQIQLLGEYRASLIYHCVTGKMEV
jgi:type I restriction enzyme S subunit